MAMSILFVLAFAVLCWYVRSSRGLLCFMLAVALSAVIVALEIYNWLAVGVEYKHRYRPAGRIRVSGRFFVYCKCVHCGDVIALDKWQLEDMPKRMAVCYRSSTRMGLFESLRNGVDCFEEE
jgi:hypothetical protein